MRWTILLGFLASLAALGGCFDDDCMGNDSACPAGQICIDSTCRPGCRLDRDCPTGERCIANVCTDGSDPDGDVDCTVECPEDMAPICGFCIDIHEASRQDATETNPGVDNSIATSRPGVIPWVNMIPAEASIACDAAGKRLCLAEEWIQACRGPADMAYPYGNDYNPVTCNGIDTYGRGSQHLMPTGSFEECTNGYGVYDMSGNVWEIDQNVAGWVHGGAYNCIDSETLHLCSYNQNFGVDPRSNVGFRCCSDGI